MTADAPVGSNHHYRKDASLYEQQQYIVHHGSIAKSTRSTSRLRRKTPDERREYKTTSGRGGYGVTAATSNRPIVLEETIETIQPTSKQPLHCYHHQPPSKQQVQQQKHATSNSNNTKTVDEESVCQSSTGIVVVEGRDARSRSCNTRSKSVGRHTTCEDSHTTASISIQRHQNNISSNARPNPTTTIRKAAISPSPAAADADDSLPHKPTPRRANLSNSSNNNTSFNDHMTKSSSTSTSSKDTITATPKSISNSIRNSAASRNSTNSSTKSNNKNSAGSEASSGTSSSIKSRFSSERCHQVTTNILQTVSSRDDSSRSSMSSTTSYEDDDDSTIDSSYFSYDANGITAKTATSSKANSNNRGKNISSSSNSNTNDDADEIEIQNAKAILKRMELQRQQNIRSSSNSIKHNKQQQQDLMKQQDVISKIVPSPRKKKHHHHQRTPEKSDSFNTIDLVSYDDSNDDDANAVLNELLLPSPSASTSSIPDSPGAMLYQVLQTGNSSTLSETCGVGRKQHGNNNIHYNRHTYNTSGTTTTTSRNSSSSNHTPSTAPDGIADNYENEKDLVHIQTNLSSLLQSHSEMSAFQSPLSHTNILQHPNDRHMDRKEHPYHHHRQPPKTPNNKKGNSTTNALKTELQQQKYHPKNTPTSPSTYLNQVTTPTVPTRPATEASTINFDTLTTIGNNNIMPSQSDMSELTGRTSLQLDDAASSAATTITSVQIQQQQQLSSPLSASTNHNHSNSNVSKKSDFHNQHSRFNSNHSSNFSNTQKQQQSNTTSINVLHSPSAMTTATTTSRSVFTATKSVRPDDDAGSISSDHIRQQLANKKRLMKLKLPVVKPPMDTIHSLSTAASSSQLLKRNGSSTHIISKNNSMVDSTIGVQVDAQSVDTTEEMNYYNHVSKHSVLVLVTEDLLSDSWKMVDYALYRLYEICCTVARQPGTPTAIAEPQLIEAANNRIRFIKSGGHALLVGVMKKFPDVLNVQISASRLIAGFIDIDTEGAFGELFSAVNGVDSILTCLKRFPDGQAYSHAALALVNIITTNLKQIKRLMDDPTHLVLFIQAMQTVSNESVGLCRVLRNITLQPDHHDTVIMAGGMEEIFREMQHHETNEDVQVCGCAALAHIVSASTKSSTAEHMVDNLDGASLIGHAMKSFPDNEELQEKAVLVLFHFSSWPAVQTSIKTAGGLSALGIALENFPEHRQIQKLGYATMKRLLEAGRSNNGCGSGVPPQTPSSSNEKQRK